MMAIVLGVLALGAAILGASLVWTHSAHDLDPPPRRRPSGLQTHTEAWFAARAIRRRKDIWKLAAGAQAPDEPMAWALWSLVHAEAARSGRLPEDAAPAVRARVGPVGRQILAGRTWAAAVMSARHRFHGDARWFAAWLWGIHVIRRGPKGMREDAFTEALQELRK